MQHIKQKIWEKCLELIQQRKSVCENSLQMLQESLHAETKSSAGDKHETGRAMIQLEREQLGLQLAQIEEDERLLMKINPEIKTDVVRVGSLVETSDLSFFIALSLGKINCDQKEFYVISAASPMGEILLGKSKNDQFSFRNKEIVVLDLV